MMILTSYSHIQKKYNSVRNICSEVNSFSQLDFFFKFFFVLLICTDNNAAPQEKNHLLSDIIPRSPWNGYVLDITRVAKMAKNWWRRDMSRIWICWECQNGPIFFLNGLFWHSRDRKWAISAFSAYPYAWFISAILDHFRNSRVIVTGKIELLITVLLVSNEESRSGYLSMTFVELFLKNVQPETDPSVKWFDLW